MAWEWLNQLINSKPVQTVMAVGNGALNIGKAAANSPVGKVVRKAVPFIGHYATGNTIGNHIGTIAGVDNPEQAGYIGGLANMGIMPATGIAGEVFDGAYGVGEVLTDLAGTTPFYSKLLEDWDPHNMVKKSFWDKERLQDPEWVAARDRYLAGKQQQQVNNTPITETVYTPSETPIQQQTAMEQVQPQPTYDTDKLVNGIIRGDYDNGAERIKRLSKLGLSLNEIHNLQQLVNQRLRRK